jgi:hypothetical protein
MERFIHRENLRRLREILTRAESAGECKRIVRLIEEEELKYQASVDAGTQKRNSVARGTTHKALRRTHG